MPTFQTFVALGDSFTRGIGDPVPGCPAGSALDQVADELRRLNPQLHYVNLAQRGLTTRQILNTQLEPALALRPDLVSVMPGGNDCLKDQWAPSAFQADFRAMLSSFPTATLITATLPDFSERLTLPPDRCAQLSAHLQEANRVIREVSSDLGALLVEFDWDDHPGVWSQDGIHPNARGYALAARHLLASLGMPAAQV